MSLSGRLEDMTLLEILQIIAFSKKTGTLRVTAPLTSGAILFRDGMMHCAVSTGTAPLVRQLAGQPLDRTRTLLFQDQIKLALHEIVGAREGSFSFRNLRQAPASWENMDVSFFLATEGVDPQQIMLELARELDEARADTSSLLDPPGDFDFAVGFGRELSEELDASPGEGRSAHDASALRDHQIVVVVVDDEPQVLQCLEEALRGAGCTVHVATGPEEALRHLEKRDPASNWFVLTDVGMPSSDGESFDGGLELVETLIAEENGFPVMLMVEALTPESRKRAKRLGIRKVAFKPTLTKPDAHEYASDLQAFASVVIQELISLVELTLPGTASGAKSPSLDQDVMFDFLKTMTDQLARPSGGIVRNMLRMATRHAERALVFLVKGSRASGLAGVRRGQATKIVTDQTRSLAFELQEIRPFAEVVYSRGPVHADHDLGPIDIFEQGKANDYVLLPVLHNHEVLAILFCDNVNTGAPLPNLAGLELFLVQTGIALENASLHRRLRSLASQFSIENQGPLTEELSRMVRSSS
jgi:CheY-like chemotaxis protein